MATPLNLQQSQQIVRTLAGLKSETHKITSRGDEVQLEYVSYGTGTIRSARKKVDYWERDVTKIHAGIIQRVCDCYRNSIHTIQTTQSYTPVATPITSQTIAQEFDNAIEGLKVLNRVWYAEDDPDSKRQKKGVEDIIKDFTALRNLYDPPQNNSVPEKPVEKPPLPSQPQTIEEKLSDIKKKFTEDKEKCDELDRLLNLSSNTESPAASIQQSPATPPKPPEGKEPPPVDVKAKLLEIRKKRSDKADSLIKELEALIAENKKPAPYFTTKKLLGILTVLTLILTAVEIGRFVHLKRR